MRGVLVVACALLCGAGAAAQDAARPVIHLGLILPEVAEDSGNPFMAPHVAAIADGVTMAAEEFAANAAMLDTDVRVDVVSSAPASLALTAETLHDGGAVAFAGAVDDAGTRTLGAWAAGKGVPYLNAFATGDALRNASCTPTTFHVVPSSAMYLDAIAGWYVRAGFRDWHFVQADTAEAEAEYARASAALEERHFGAREVGHSVVAAGADFAAAIEEIRDSRATAVVLVLPASDQLRALAAMEAAGLAVETIGFPAPETQARAFFAASRAAAPRLGTGRRATSWEPTLDAYGARELNARFLERFGRPMEGGAWAGYQAVKILYEAAMFGGAPTSEAMLGYLDADTSVFDVWKGIGASFRPWDHQLRQTLYLVKISADDGEGLAAGQLVGELPAIYMPGTDPVERLDQLGNLEAHDGCTQ